MPLNRKQKLFTDSIKRIDFRNRIIIFVILAILISLFLPRGIGLEFNYELGDITEEEIVAEFDFPIYKDDAKYRADQKAAIREVPYYFERKDEIKEEQSSRIHEFLSHLQRVRRAQQNLKEAQQQWWEAGGQDGGHDPDYFARVQARVKTDSASLSQELSNFNASYPFDLSNSEWREFLGNGEPRADRINYEEFATSIVNISRGLWTYGILSTNKKNIQSDVIDIVYKGIHDENLNKNDFLDIPEALGKARIELESSYLDPNDIRRTVGTKIVGEFLRPNLIYNSAKTEKEQVNKMAEVSQAIGRVSKNERIVDANTRITPESLQKIKSYIRAWLEKNEKATLLDIVSVWIARFLLVGIVLSFFFTFLRTYRQTLFEDNRMILLFSTMYLMMVVVGWTFAIWLELSEYAIPITVAAMVFTVLLDARIAVMATVTLAIILAFMVGNKLDFVIVSLFSSVAAVFAVRQLRARIQIFYAILYILVSGSVAIISIGLLKEAHWNSILDNLLYLSVGAVLAPFITYGLSALYEIVFGITSDLTLLELTDFNHPLLKRLSQEANGTFNHSVVVGNLSESCANAVGANPLLCRVGAYYHDIGKMIRPEYYIENQMEGDNKHDTLSPTLSATIISSHVKDGLKLAREYRLPSLISDFIPMHHGTTRIEYFYRRAIELADGDESKVNESDFQYSGPTPNTKETGILMICEAVEAAVRSIKKPTLGSIEAMVDKITEKRLKEGQLDNCPLTMRDLAKLKGDVRGKHGLLPVIRGIYHIRVEYPGTKTTDSTPAT